MPESTPSAIRCILGLGNPGPLYTNTRHNAGAWFVQALAHVEGASFQIQAALHMQVAKASIQGQAIYLCLPTQFMNLSGSSVQAFLRYHKIPLEACLVAHDELDLPNGTVRLKWSGGHAGHNGLRDIMQKMGGKNDFSRLRIGIGRPIHAKQSVADFVLQKPSLAEKLVIDKGIQAGLSVLPDLVSGDFSKAIQQLHSKA